MAYDENLANRMREIFSSFEKVEEKEMFGGLCFMLNDKMCAGIIREELMLRVAPEKHEELVELPGCRDMDFTKRPMKGYLYVSQDVLNSRKELKKWIDLAIDFNAIAKSSKKIKKA
jgi:TfoX/Sxy family transcriptional regulator of competence genes